MSLIRFDGATRQPSAQLLHGMVDWVRGSLAAALGQADFDDYSPYNASNHALDGTTGFAAVVKDVREDVKGVITVDADADDDSKFTMIRNTVTELDKVQLAYIGAKFDIVEHDDEEVMVFLGLTDQYTDAENFASAPTAIATGNSENMLGFRRNFDGSIDVVANVAGTLTVLIDDVVAAGLTTANADKQLELRIEKQTSTKYRLVPAVDGSIVRDKITVVASTAIPLVAMRPIFGIAGDSSDDDPTADVDWTAFFDK